MAAETTSVFKLAVPGRPLQLEMPYDCRSDAMIPGDSCRGEPRCKPSEVVCEHTGPCRTLHSTSSGTRTAELRLILIGSTGAGKSATGNTILRRKEFESRASAVSVTRECKKGEGEWEGGPLLVVDTPGFLSATVNDEEAIPELQRCSNFSFPGPNAILLVLQAGRFTLEERESMQRFRHIFGKGVEKFMVIVFTRKDDMEGEPLQTFVKKSEKKLKELVKSCGRRVCAFNNRATGEEREQQVRGLFQMICNMLYKMLGGHNWLRQDRVDREFWQRICNL